MHCAKGLCKWLESCLFQGGANPDATEDNSPTRPIDAAAAAQHREIVEMLLPCTTPAEGGNWTADSLLLKAAAVAQGHSHQHSGGCCGHDHSHDEAEEEVLPAASTTPLFSCIICSWSAERSVPCQKKLFAVCVDAAACLRPPLVA